MKTLSELDRNDVIRAIALVAVAAFPLMAYAQLGSAAKLTSLSTAAAPAVAESIAPLKTVAIDSCANQHWPFFSAECLRGSTQAIKPRLVAMNVEDTSASVPQAQVAAPGAARHGTRLSDSDRSNARSVKPAKPAKPRVAHARERRPPGISYAANMVIAPIAAPGW